MKNLDGQFTISAHRVPCREGWRTFKLGGLNLNLAPGVRPVSVHRNGERIGVLLGNPIDLDTGRVVRTCHDIAGDLEKAIYRLAGSWLFVLSHDGVNRVYLDANGMLSLVYDREAGIAGSTAAAILTDEQYRSRFRDELYRKLDIEHDGWFPADLTAHAGVDRLLANHYLDLDTMRAARHWPKAPFPVDEDVAAAGGRICARVTRTVAALAADGQTAVALTAGNDTRLLLACCRPLVNDVSFATVEAPKSNGGSVDVDIATRLARGLRLSHELLPYVGATNEQAELWRLRAGHSVGGVNVAMHPSVSPLDGRTLVGGVGGELGRGFLWLGATRDTRLDASGLVARLKLPQEPRVLSAVAAWLDGLQPYGFDTLALLDLAYIELRMSGWGFADTYAYPAQRNVCPFVSRDNYVDMLSMPVEARRGNAWFRQAVADLWPQLLNYPINRYGDHRDMLHKVTNIVRNPGRAVRKIEQIVRTKVMS
jgi:hypothetical protein